MPQHVIGPWTRLEDEPREPSAERRLDDARAHGVEDREVEFLGSPLYRVRGIRAT